MHIKLIWQSEHYTYLANINETLIFELGELRHRAERIGSAHSQYPVLPPMTLFDRRLETILVRASQDVVKKQNVERWLAVQIPLGILYKYTFLSHNTRRKFESI